MRPSREPDYAKEHREFTNTIRAIQEGTRHGLTYRPMELTEETRKRGGRKSRRRTARVWAPRQLERSEDS